jgi:hypothetical protein
MRYYQVQILDSRKGWQDIPLAAYAGAKEANDRAKEVAEYVACPARTIRKPVGWVPFSPSVLKELTGKNPTS